MLSITTSLLLDCLCVSLLVPLPGARDDLIELGELWLPAQLGLDLLRTRHQHRRIARPPWTFLNRDGPSRHATHRLDHLKYGEPLPVANVVDQPASILAERA